MHPNTGVGSSRGEQMGLGNFQLFRFFTYRHLEHEKVEKSKKLEVTQTHLLTPRTTYSGVGMHVLLSSKLKTAPLGQEDGVFQPPRGVLLVQWWSRSHDGVR